MPQLIRAGENHFSTYFVKYFSVKLDITVLSFYLKDEMKGKNFEDIRLNLRVKKFHTFNVHDLFNSEYNSIVSLGLHTQSIENV